MLVSAFDESTPQLRSGSALSSPGAATGTSHLETTYSPRTIKRTPKSHGHHLRKEPPITARAFKATTKRTAGPRGSPPHLAISSLHRSRTAFGVPAAAPSRPRGPLTPPTAASCAFRSPPWANLTVSSTPPTKFPFTYSCVTRQLRVRRQRSAPCKRRTLHQAERNPPCARRGSVPTSGNSRHGAAGEGRLVQSTASRDA